MGQKDNNETRVNWGAEVLRVLRIIGRVLFKIFSYFMNILLTILLIGLITGIIVCSVFAIYINNYLDLEIDPSTIVSTNRDSTTRIFYMKYDTMEDRINRNGTAVEIEDQRLYEGENSIAVTYSQIPENLVNAFIAIEDHRFWSHNGVDWWTTAQAVFNFVLPTGNSAGGSTITQQLIKNVTEEDDVTIQRKVQEIFRALNLEKVKSKEEIITAYLNIIYLGCGCDGVQSAA
ncbi:MAG: transglycosylase domain-containing protein, partial [Eubacteriales bacterium]